jgi:uncharacterized protein
MKRLFVQILLCCLLPLAVAALEVPPLAGRINDHAQLLSPATVQQLDRDLAALEQRDSTQIVVLTVPTLAGDTIEEFGIRTAEAWHIGQRGKDNGVILLVAKAEKKMRIEVGRGLEGTLTDFLASQIIRTEMAPKFRANDFDGGIQAGVAALIKAVAGEYVAKPVAKPRTHRGPAPLTLFLVVAVGCLFAGTLSRVLGGIAGAVGLPLASFFAFSGIGIPMLLGLAVGGFALGMILPALFGHGGGYQGPFWWGGGGGGFGGGGGGDGFSGGGGDFGGGGASGDW